MKNENSVETEGKPRLDLLPFAPLIEITRAMEAGIAKRDGEKNDWKPGVRYGKYFAKVLRHTLAWWLGEDIDSDTGCHHLACAGADLLILFDCILRGVGADDRWKSSTN